MLLFFSHPWDFTYTQVDRLMIFKKLKVYSAFRAAKKSAGPTLSVYMHVVK